MAVWCDLSVCKCWFLTVCTRSFARFIWYVRSWILYFFVSIWRKQCLTLGVCDLLRCVFHVIKYSAKLKKRDNFRVFFLYILHFDTYSLCKIIEQKTHSWILVYFLVNFLLSVLLVWNIEFYTDASKHKSIAISKALRKFVDAIIDPIECVQKKKKLGVNGNRKKNTS